MMRRVRSHFLAPAGIAVLTIATAASGALPAGAAGRAAAVHAPTATAASAPQAVVPTLSAMSRLADRRAAVVGHRFYSVGTEDGEWPAMGFHTRGEMGGMWSMPIKLLDGIWFEVGGTWLAQATRFSSGAGYTQYLFRPKDGLRVTRTDVASDSHRAGLIRLELSSARPRTLRLAVDAHSELMKSYPWGETKPTRQTTYNLQDSAHFSGRALVFREQGTPPARHAERHDYAAVVGSSLDPLSGRTGRGFRGPRIHPVICGPSGPDAPPAPPRCDDTAYGKGAGGRMDYRVKVGPNQPTTVWFAVSGSDNGLAAARRAQSAVLASPARQLRAKQEQRVRQGAHSVVDLPGDRLLEKSIVWSKQNLLDSVQTASDLELRVTNAGTRYPRATGTLPKARWIGAGWPDYPWIFGTDGEYTAFASVAMGQFAAIEAHLRTLRDVSNIVNHRSGKVVHEVTPDGAVYFGANTDEGNTDETAKMPSAIALVWRWSGDNAFRDHMYGFAKRNMHYIFRTLDVDGDGWPEGLGNVEREGMGEEKLDNTVYTIRGLRDLQDMALSKGDSAEAAWAGSRAKTMEQRFEAAWWYGQGTRQYADSLDDPGNKKVFQRHWIGLTPTEAVLVRPGQQDRPLASQKHAVASVEQRERACYSGEFGLFHTGTGPTSDPDGNHGATCDSVVSEVQSERSVFTLNTSIMAVAEGNLGRFGESQQRRYSDDNARVQVGARVSEQPGSMPEISPSPDFGANIDKPFNERSSVLQAWGNYGTLWPVVHQQLGVSPDMGRRQLRVVPAVPDGQHIISGSNILLGAGSIDVTAQRSRAQLETRVSRHVDASLVIGHLLRHGDAVADVTLNGHPTSHRIVTTARGRELLVNAPRHNGTDVLQVTLR